MTRAELRAQRESPIGPPVGGDIARQFTVVVAVAAALVLGVIAYTSPGSIAGLQGGALASDGSFLGVQIAAWSVWAALYVGLAGYAVWQALPRERTAIRQREVGWWIAGVAALDALWAASVVWAPLWSTGVIAVILVVVLGVAYARAVKSARPRSPWVELILIDGVVGLHLGWAIFASLANATAVLTGLEPPYWAENAALWSAVLIGLAVLLGLFASALGGWRVMPPLAIAWGLLWVAIERLTGEPYSVMVGVAAAVGAGVLAIVPTGIRVALALRATD